MTRQGRRKKEVERSSATAAGVAEPPDTVGPDASVVDIVEPQGQDEVEMVRRATEVLGIDHVARWMQSKIPSLGNQTPYDLLQTQDGREQVERVLLKIEHGVY